MAYIDKVVNYTRNPQNVGSLDKTSRDVGTGFVGAPACGDVLKLQIFVVEGVVKEVKFKTFGCGSAIASSSLATEMMLGKTVQQLLDMSQTINQVIAKELALPPVKLHCSLLAREAIVAALRDYMNKQKPVSDGVISVPINLHDDADEGAQDI